ncbi:lipocalin family protein [Cellulomonas sp. PhB150]|uniref:lipocalin family protein n=1 Tax=Cellulomonas sp. PhB150 TaxID=2485188 RepID=UPI000F4664CD|nr:lipocalin family protein [Cellulomonas sp. PhB150]ROS25923.1 apolipoprotein D and lipocalin family protein [Cellulomonas sp. PhB150]
MTRRLLARAAAIAAVAVLGVSLAAPANAAEAPPRPVASVDVAKYVGSWYQVAAVPAIYELQCAKNVTATYGLNADGTISVTNTCKTWFGGTSTVKGNARSENAPANSSLTVSFLKLGGSWLYFGGPNYQVLGLGAQYDWAVVGDPSRASGFVLSRTPALTATQLADVRATLAANGYDACDLKLTKQDGGSSSRAPLC